MVPSLHINTLLVFFAVLCAKNVAKKDFFRKYLLATSCENGKWNVPLTLHHYYQFKCSF